MKKAISLIVTMVLGAIVCTIIDDLTGVRDVFKDVSLLAHAVHIAAFMTWGGISTFILFYKKKS